MNVRELITKLSRLNQDLTIEVYNGQRYAPAEDVLVLNLIGLPAGARTVVVIE